MGNSRGRLVRWLVASVTVTVLFIGSSQPAHAGIFDWLVDTIGGVFGKLTGVDPAKVAELTRIVSAIQTLNDRVGKLRQFTEDISEIQQKIYPLEALTGGTDIYIEPVAIMYNEFKALANEWRDLSGRGLRLQERWFGGEGLKRTELESWTGSPKGFLGEDLETYYDLQAARRLGSIGDYYKTSYQQVQTQEALASLSAGASVGLAERLTALGAAALGTNVAHGAKLEAEMMDLSSERLMRRVRERRLAQTSSIMTYMVVSGQGSPLAPTPVTPTDGIILK